MVVRYLKMLCLWILSIAFSFVLWLSTVWFKLNWVIYSHFGVIVEMSISIFKMLHSSWTVKWKKIKVAALSICHYVWKKWLIAGLLFFCRHSVQNSDWLHHLWRRMRALSFLLLLSQSRARTAWIAALKVPWMSFFASSNSLCFCDQACICLITKT